ncbi:MAG: S-layer homology domain-containing protein, partial [Ruminococcaceae bacterium]|nr:S-layer homology domain-containing protein [Oscillospiraceae bacterium]
ALVSSKALMMRGETFFITEDLHKKIPDYNQVGKEYTMYVEMAYSMGILCGVDDKGTFAPLQTLTRAEAATVLYRIINTESRNPVSLVNYDGGTVTPETQTQGAITIKEGQESVRRFAKEGDIVIKADGTQVVLKKGVHGIVGEGQGVAPDLGVKLSENAMYSEVVRAKNSEGGMNFTGATSYKDGSGTPVMNGSYYVNKLTGEGHWDGEWQVISPKPTTKGSFDFQLSSDKNWIWNADSGEWMCGYANNISDQVIQIINQANGL